MWIRNELCIGDEKFSDISDIIKLGNVSVSLRERTLFTGEKIIAPPRAEYIIMELLMLSGGSYISAHDMLSEIGRYNTNAAMGLVWVYISCLRKHLAYIGANIEIKLKRGVGYALALKE